MPWKFCVLVFFPPWESRGAFSELGGNGWSCECEYLPKYSLVLYLVVFCLISPSVNLEKGGGRIWWVKGSSVKVSVTWHLLLSLGPLLTNLLPVSRWSITSVPLSPLPPCGWIPALPAFLAPYTGGSSAWSPAGGIRLPIPGDYFELCDQKQPLGLSLPICKRGKNNSIYYTGFFVLIPFKNDIHKHYSSSV